MVFIASPNEAPNSVGIVALPDQSSREFGGGGAGGGGGGGVMNITIGNNVISRGYSKSLFGATDTEKPTPPIPPAAPAVIVQAVVQLIGLDWALTLVDTTAIPGTGPAQNVFTTVTFTGGAGPIVLTSASATYTLIPAAPFDTGAQWTWPATVDVWFSLGDGTMVTATFA